MSTASMVVADENGGREYSHEVILENPIPARCSKCKQLFSDEDGTGGNGAIHTPALAGCRCWYCSGQLVPLERGGARTVEQVMQLKSREAAQPMLEMF